MKKILKKFKMKKCFEKLTKQHVLFNITKHAFYNLESEIIVLQILFQIINSR